MSDKKNIQPPEKPSNLKLKKTDTGETPAPVQPGGRPGASAFSTDTGRATADDRHYIMTHRLTNLALLDRMTEEEARRIVTTHRRRRLAVGLGRIFVALVIVLAALGGWQLWQEMQPEEKKTRSIEYQLNSESWSDWIASELQIVVLRDSPAGELRELLNEQETLFLALVATLQKQDGSRADRLAAWNTFEEMRGHRIPELVAANEDRCFSADSPFQISEREKSRLLVYGQFGSRRLYFPVTDSPNSGLRLERTED